jgi:nitrite reductase/ring-hydroxylating ferredoxin subunit
MLPREPHTTHLRVRALLFSFFFPLLCAAQNTRAPSFPAASGDMIAVLPVCAHTYHGQLLLGARYPVRAGGCSTFSCPFTHLIFFLRRGKCVCTPRKGRAFLRGALDAGGRTGT